MRPGAQNMDRIVIRSGLSEFLLLDRVLAWNGEKISAIRHYDAVPVFAGIESCAQLAALHVRYGTRFGCHAFLLKIKALRLPETRFLTGRYAFRAERTGGSRRAFSYRVAGTPAKGAAITADLLIGTMDYNADFSRDVLKPHYEKVFSCLTNGSHRGFATSAD